MEDINGRQFGNGLRMLNSAGVGTTTFPNHHVTAAEDCHQTIPEKDAQFNSRLDRDSAPQSRKSRSGVVREFLLGSHLGWMTFDFLGAFLCAAVVLSFGERSARMTNATVLSTSAFVCALLFASCIALLAHWSPLGHLEQGDGGAHEQLQILKTVALANVAVGGVLSLFGGVAVNRVAPGLLVVLTFSTMTVARSYWRWRRLSWRRRGNFVRNFAIAGVTEESRQVCEYLTSLSYGSYNFKGFISIDDSAPAAGIDPDSVIGSIGTVMPLARSIFVDEIFLIKRPDTIALKRVIEQARSADIDLRLIPDISETLNRRTDVHYIGDMPTIVLHRTNTQEVSRFFKRSIDVLGAGFALFLLAPLFLLLGIAIKWDSPGPVFYGSDRVGLKGRSFRCYKFRTMVRNAHELRSELKHLNERDGVLFKIARDPRITRLGRIFRKYSLDELPQLWNVLLGDMSLVGPRPPIGDEVVQYQIDQFCRLEVPPGITGLWQIEARSNPSFESYIELDRKYVNTWSFWLDLRILFRTAAVVVGGTGT